MRIFELATRGAFGLIAVGLLFLAGALFVVAGIDVVRLFANPTDDMPHEIMQIVGYAVISIAVFEVARYIFEEAIDPAEMRHAGEARRSLTKFVSTIAIAVFLEALVMIFQASRTPELEEMLYPTLLLLAGVAVIVGLGAYQRMSASAERDLRSSPDTAAEEEAALERHKEKE